jgi:hypothetical protein
LSIFCRHDASIVHTFRTNPTPDAFKIRLADGMSAMQRDKIVNIVHTDGTVGGDKN